MDFTQLLNQSPTASQSSQAVSARSASSAQTKSEPGEFFAVFKSSMQQASHQNQATRSDKPQAFQAPDKRAAGQAGPKLPSSDNQPSQAKAPVQSQAPVADKPEPQAASQAALETDESQPLTACQHSLPPEQETDDSQATTAVLEQPAPVVAPLPAKISSAELTELLFRQQIAGMGATQESSGTQPDEKPNASAAAVIPNQISQGAQVLAETTALEAVAAKEESGSSAQPVASADSDGQADAAQQAEHAATQAPSLAEQPTASGPDSANQIPADEQNNDPRHKSNPDADAIAQAEAAAALLASMVQTHGQLATPAAPATAETSSPVQAASGSERNPASEQAAVNVPAPVQNQSNDQQAQIQAEQQLRQAALQQLVRHQLGAQATGLAQLGARNSAAGGMRLEGFEALLKPDGEISQLLGKLVSTGTGAAGDAVEDTQAAPIQSDSHGAGQANLAWQQSAETTYGTQGQRVDAPHAASATAAATAPAELAEKFQLIRQLTDKIQLMQNARQQAIQLTLHPAELGRLSLRLQQESQQLHLQILTESPLAKDLIESQLPGLRQQLESQGLQLHQVTIDLHPDWSQAHQQAGHEQGRHPQPGHAGHGPAFSLDAEAGDESAPIETMLKTNDGSSVNTLA